MGIKVNVKWMFKVNGKEYGSVDEMPSDVRGAYEKAKGTFGITTSEVVFNGQEYQGLEKMPRDVRQEYEKVMRAAETGEITSDLISGAEYGTTSKCSIGVARSPNAPRPIEPESTLSLSPRMLIVGLALLILLMGFYFVLAR
jgi:hypothetical protein